MNLWQNNAKSPLYWNNANTMDRDTVEENINNKTFNEKIRTKNADSFHNPKTYLVKNEITIPNSNQIHFSTIKKKSKLKPKIQNMIGKKSHTKGNYSVYTKDFNKLMKEQSVVDRMSARRIRPQNTYEEINPVFNSMVVPSSQKKSLRKPKRNNKDNVTADPYHKRVKSDQIYSIKLLLRNEDKLKASKNKVYFYLQ